MMRRNPSTKLGLKNLNPNSPMPLSTIVMRVPKYPTVSPTVAPMTMPSHIRRFRMICSSPRRSFSASRRRFRAWARDSDVGSRSGGSFCKVE